MPATDTKFDQRNVAQLPLRVFVVEDSALVRQRLLEWFDAPGLFEFIGFSETQQAAIDALCAAPADVVILDIKLKQGTGIGVLQALRKRLPPPRTVFIMLTNFATLHFRTRCIVAGADYFFDKALDLERVRQVLEQLVAGRRDDGTGASPERRRRGEAGRHLPGGCLRHRS